MKIEQKLKAILIILLIVLVALISFVGIFVQNKKSMENILPEFLLGMDLSGARHITLSVDTSTKEVIYDKDGNIVTVADEKNGTTTKQEPINSEEILTSENYKKSKEIIEKRLKGVNVSEYTIKEIKEDGSISLQIPEDNKTDLAIGQIYSIGDLTIEDEQGNVLLSNENLKEAQVTYGTTDAGTIVNLSLVFKEDSIEKLKEITNTYVKTTDEEGNETTKNVIIKIDGSQLTSTCFEEEISNGTLPLTIGSATNSNSTFQSYVQQASTLAILLNSGEMPIIYTFSENRYVESDITLETIMIAVIIVAVVALLSLIYLIVKYKKNGLITSISYVGYVAILLIVIRYANVMVTIEGIVGIVVSMALNYVFNFYLLKMLKNSETEFEPTFTRALVKILFILIPTLITAITLCFAGWTPIYSFGMIMFWGLLIMFVYNIVITKTLIKSFAKK